MENRISISELAEVIAREKDVSEEQAVKFVRLFFETIEDCLLRDKIVKIKGLGTFKIVDVADRESIDVNTSARILIQGHSKVTYTPDTALRDRVNKPFAAFGTIILNDGTDLEEMTKIPEDVDSIEESITADQSPVSVEVTETEKVDTIPASSDSSESVVSTLESAPVESSESTRRNLKDNTLNPQSQHVEIDESTAREKEDHQLEHSEEVADDTVESESLVEKEVKTETEVVSAPLSMLSGSEGGETIPKKSNLWKYLLQACAVLLLMASSYFAGYFKLLCPVCDKVKVEKKENVGKKGEKVATKQDDSLSVRSQKPAPQPRPEDQYAQVPGGKYLIVGTKGTREMKIGDTLYKMAREEYGDKEYAKYIIVHNNFSNPDVIPLGYEVKLPLLK